MIFCSSRLTYISINHTQPLGSAATCSVSLHEFWNAFVVSQIVGRSLNLAMDVPSGMLDRRAVATIKSLTGHDRVSINRKYQMPFTYDPFVKLLFGCNGNIRLQEDDTAFWNRLVLVPFLYSIPPKEQQADLLEQLWSEREGIVHKAMLALQKVYQNGWKFPSCVEADMLKAEWSGEHIRDIMDFVENHCVLDKAAFSGTKALYSAFESLYPCCFSEKYFVGVLRRQFDCKTERHKIDGEQQRGLNGIRLKTI